jgi:xylan 1,4-beta-xylosidase
MLRIFRSLVLAVLVSAAVFAQAQTDLSQPVAVTINAQDAGTPFPHFWEQMFGSGRAIVSLRQSYRDDLSTVKDATGFQAVRFHGIFMDDVGLYDPSHETVNPGQSPQADPNNTTYNFSYVDQIYDGLLAKGVRPFVELSFMPKKMASDPAALHAFWYKQNVSPPKEYELWDKMITAFVQHLISRYGIDEVSGWDFEVWNEPNIDFWVGKPAQSTYFELYDQTALAIKKVSNRLRVGGPATAQAAWVSAFLKHCHDNHVPVDFVTTHVYGNDSAKDVFHTDEQIPRDHMVCAAVHKVHDEIASSPFPKAPLILSEYNASYANEPDVTDTVYMGPWLASTISQCDGLTQAMSYWTFSDVFEEQGVVKTPFYGGFGLIAEDDIPKPAFNAFAMLHLLGNRRIEAKSDSVLATRQQDGAIVIALWNYTAPYGSGPSYTPPPDVPGPLKSFTVTLTGMTPDAAVKVWRLDANHGNVIKTYDAMGRPSFPTREQIAELRAAGKPALPETTSLRQNTIKISIPPQGLVVLRVEAKKN